ncbi:type IX secretion system sortase PorU [Bergeyella sp. RCAD1439]|uniref:type IX secretion system sortase PorU n=1 Tax=Bergeyella anatis TaxID=3113737 RepID=UPI002E19C699|nr:type IX secretion system sortase PorU [Bergeyella sp. RCAD1439]
MRRELFFLAALFSASFLTAQKVDLVWNDTETVDYGSEKIVYPKFENKGYEASGLTVYLNHQIASNGKKYQIASLAWEEISPKELYGLSANELPQNDETNINYHLSPDNTEIFTARLAALKNENGKIYRLRSFTLVDQTASPAKTKGHTSKIIGTTENPLKNGTFYKIRVDKSGIFKITPQFLRNNGINPSSINPKNIRIYGNGGLALPEFNEDSRYASLQENAIQVVGEEDGVFNEEDYILFYAQGPHGFNVYNSGHQAYLRNTRTETRTDRSHNFVNIYDDYAYYFINFDLGEGKRILDDTTTLPTTLLTRYDDYQYINEDKTNILKIGRLWLGDAITSPYQVKFSKRSPFRPDDVLIYRVAVAAYKAQNTSIAFDINGLSPLTQNVGSPISDLVKYTSYNGSTTGFSGTDIQINITPNLTANPAGLFYIDYAEIIYKEDLDYNGTQMNFRSYDVREGTGTRYGFALSNALGAEQVWDVSDLTNVKRKINLSSSNGTYSFAYNADSEVFNNEFVAFKHASAYSPHFLGRIDPQDLHGLQNIDYLIVTSKAMIPQAARLASHHETNNNWRTAVVDVEAIYNEFSSGSKDITAIRDFVSRLKNETGNLQYLLLLGDTSYDYKNKTPLNDNIIPAYQSEESGNFINSYVTDDYFAMTAPQTASSIAANMPDIPVGRLPASNLQQAKLLVDKTLAYYNALPGQSSPFGAWRMNLNFVVDDDYDGGSPFHNVMENSLINTFETGSLRKEYNIGKLYLDAYPAQATAAGQRFPQINQAISNAVGNSLYLFYFGHGGINGWAQERVLTVNDIQNFNNFTSVYSRFPLVSTITCEFTLWDEPEVQSAGEQVIKHNSGGAATMITSSRAIGVPYGRQFTDIFTQYMFQLQNNDFLRLGDAFLAAKKRKGLDSNHLRVNFLGDPAMKLSRPKPLLSIDKIETPVDGQLRALDFVKITGKVLREDGTLDQTFNGKAVASVFDKKLQKETLNNDNSSNMLPKLKFTEEGSAIVKAASKVVNGTFTMEFYVPKDINYDLGEGRLLLYADNFETAKSAAYDVFNNQNLNIGGINENGLNDKEPPKVHLYMNNTHFADGGITDQNPTLLACITDNTGINSTGSGIGHDITVILDGEVVNTIVLNDFFAAGESNGCLNPSLADYQKGSVTYPFRNLTPGTHQLTFKVWDINNNSTTSTLNFVVKDESDQKLKINRLLNWPNPFTSHTSIQFEHNCDDVLEVNVQIYTLTGRLVRTLSIPVSAEPFMEGYRTPRQAIIWDGKDDFGDSVGKGTYIFKVFAKSQNQDRCKGGASAVEKMVLLK